MPTILRIEGFRFFFFSNEGREKPHVHIESGENYAKYWLNQWFWQNHLVTILPNFLICES